MTPAQNSPKAAGSAPAMLTRAMDGFSSPSQNQLLSALVEDDFDLWVPPQPNAVGPTGPHFNPPQPTSELFSSFIIPSEFEPVLPDPEILDEEGPFHTRTSDITPVSISRSSLPQTPANADTAYPLPPFNVGNPDENLDNISNALSPLGDWRTKAEFKTYAPSPYNTSTSEYSSLTPSPSRLVSSSEENFIDELCHLLNSDDFRNLFQHPYPVRSHAHQDARSVSLVGSPYAQPPHDVPPPHSFGAHTVQFPIVQALPPYSPVPVNSDHLSSHHQVQSPSLPIQNFPCSPSQSVSLAPGIVDQIEANQAGSFTSPSSESLSPRPRNRRKRSAPRPVQVDLELMDNLANRIRGLRIGPNTPSCDFEWLLDLIHQHRPMISYYCSTLDPPEGAPVNGNQGRGLIKRGEDYSGPVWVCFICKDKTFTYPHNLFHHLRSYFKAKQVACPHCFRFLTGRLRRHLDRCPNRPKESLTTVIESSAMH